MTFANAGVLELADEVDSKSIGGDTVRVRPPPPAPRKTRQVFPVWSQTVDKTPACFPRWGFVLRIKNNKKRLIYAVFWRFCGIMIVTNLK